MKNTACESVSSFLFISSPTFFPFYRRVPSVSRGRESDVSPQGAHRRPGEAAQHRAQSQTGRWKHDTHLLKRIYQGTNRLPRISLFSMYFVSWKQLVLNGFSPWFKRGRKKILLSVPFSENEDSLVIWHLKITYRKWNIVFLSVTKHTTTHPLKPKKRLNKWHS